MTDYVFAYQVEGGTGFLQRNPDASTVSTFNESLHKAVDDVTPSNIRADMNGW